MTVIDDLVKKLKGAIRKREKARRLYQESATETRRLLAEFERESANVSELERAVSILKNNLRPGESDNDQKVITHFKSRFNVP